MSDEVTRYTVIVEVEHGPENVSIDLHIRGAGSAPEDRSAIAYALRQAASMVEVAEVRNMPRIQ